MANDTKEKTGQSLVVRSGDLAKRGLDLADEMLGVATPDATRAAAISEHEIASQSELSGAERQELRSRIVALAAELPEQGKLASVFAHLARGLERIFAVRSVTVWLVSPPHGQLVQIAAIGTGEAGSEQLALAGADDPGLRQLAASPRPLAAAALAHDSPEMGLRMRALAAELVVPLRTREQLVGMLTVGTKSGGQLWAAEELDLLMLVGHHAATIFDSARLFDAATYDGLTGAYRREALLEILDRECSRSQRHSRPLVVALVDLDHFKQVNDRHGQLTGDLVLQHAATVMRSLLRGTDFVGRYAGDKFLYVLPETTPNVGSQFAEKVRQCIAELEIVTETGKRIRVTASIGVASVNGQGPQGGSGSGPRELTGAAQRALESAKRLGRNRVEMVPAL